MGVDFPTSNGVSEVCGNRRERINPNLQAITTAVTPDGSRIFLTTFDPLVAADTDGGKRDIYEFANGQITLISTGIPEGDHAYMYGCSDDGLRVFFGATSLFFSELWEHSGGTTFQVNVSETGNLNNATIGNIAISADGTRVVFDTYESLTADDTDNPASLDVFERSGGDTKLISKPGTGGGSTLAGISADGTKVWFDSNEQHDPAVDTNAVSDVYVSTSPHTAAPTVVSLDPDPAPGSAVGGSFQGMTPDGSHVFFSTTAGIDPADGDAAGDLYDRHGAATTWISKPNADGTDDTFPQFMASAPDGARVYFGSDGRLAASDTDDTFDIYLRTAAGLTHITRQVAGEAQNAQTGCSEVAVMRGCASTDGSRIVFSTQERLLAADTDVNGDLYRYTASTGALELVSGGGDHEYNMSQEVGVSESGERVIFGSTDPLLSCIDTDGEDADIYEWENGALTLITTPFGAGVQGNVLAGISADASAVFFASNAGYDGAGGDGELMDMFAARPGGGGGGTCPAGPPPPPPPPPQCSDGIDNDGDGAVDAQDPGCLGGASDDDESDESIGDLVLCGRREISLVRADARGKKVVLSGLVAARHAGAAVSIFTNYKPAGKSAFKKLGTAKANAAGEFSAKVKGPPKKLFRKARFEARVGTAKSVKLKLPQSLASTSVKLQGGQIVLKGKVKKALVGKRNPVVVKRVLCGRYTTVGSAKPQRSGTYTIRFDVPGQAVAALYRAESKVLRKPGSKKYVKQFARAIGITLTSQTG